MAPVQARQRPRAQQRQALRLGKILQKAVGRSLRVVARPAVAQRSHVAHVFLKFDEVEVDDVEDELIMWRMFVEF